MQIATSILHATPCAINIGYQEVIEVFFDFSLLTQKNLLQYYEKEKKEKLL